MINQEIEKRGKCCFLLSMLVQAAIFDGFIVVLKVISWHPIQGLMDWLSGMFSLWSLFHHIVLALSLGAFHLFHSKFHEVESYTSSTRWETICRLLSIQRIYGVGVFCIMGCLNACCYITYVGITEKLGFLESILCCDNAEKCVFLHFNGFFAGALFFWKYFTNDWYLLRFDLASLPNIRAVIGRVSEIIRESLKDVLMSICFSAISYRIVGPYMIRFLSTFFQGLSGVQVTLYSLLNFKLLIAAVTTSTLLLFTWRVYIELYNIVLTERVEFPIVAALDSDETYLLKNAFVSDNKIVQYLAFLDLRWLSRFSPQRRKVFFTISVPGGHPKQWSALSATCVYKLSEFLKRMEQLIMDEKSKHLISKYSVQKVAENKESTCIYDDVVNYLCNLFPVKYMLEELPDRKAMKVFTTCQPEIWVIEALGFILAAACTEDRFGVVLKSLSELIGLLINLKLCEEKLPINMMGVNKYAKHSNCLQRAIAQKQTLKSALESAIYRIVLAFKTDVRAVPLSEEHSACLEKYLEFKQ